jgi:REP element-mobilizing transposase RayT
VGIYPIWTPRRRSKESPSDWLTRSQDLLKRWRQELGSDADVRAATKLRLAARYEDAGHGSCLLRDPAHASIVEQALLHFDGERYRLLEWCIMPNHVHVLIHCLGGTTLGTIVRSWKTYTARQINASTGRSGALWAVDYFDRYIRDHEHLADAKAYIRRNPVKAGLCVNPEDWRWSSAWSGWQVQTQ